VIFRESALEECKNVSSNNKILVKPKNSPHEPTMDALRNRTGQGCGCIECHNCKLCEEFMLMLNAYYGETGIGRLIANKFVQFMAEKHIPHGTSLTQNCEWMCAFIEMLQNGVQPSTAKNARGIFIEMWQYVLSSCCKS
jgi:hypothetical protein